jgi:cysteinyl-tRNA synthetase
MGTTGTLMGLTRRFRELDDGVKIVGVEPLLGHGIQGLKNMKESYRPGIFDKSLPDTIINCRDEEAFEYARLLASREGIFAGMSSGAALAAAIETAAHMEGGTVVAIFPDGGERYLSTSLFPYEMPEEENSDVLRLTNTLTRKKEVFEPLEPGRVKIYSCGPTAYEHAHLGLCRRLVVADLLRRVLEYQGYEVRHVMNITDIDDKTIRSAIDEGKDLWEFTDLYVQAFTQDAAELNVLPAYRYPRASEYIDDMIRLAEKLEEAGYAYERHGSLYFDVSKLSSYGRLSRVDMSRIDVGRTVDLDEYEKDSPVDFTLFKRVTLEELKRGIGYDTKWGKVRPGWHIECAAMSMKLLGDYFDIHTSGCDLVFPHHENEIAMAMAVTGRPLARTWIHSELVMVEGRKMSRSAGNMMTLRQLKEMGYTGRAVRFFLLRTSYRKPLNFSIDGLDDAVKGLYRIDQFLCEMEHIARTDASSTQTDATGASREVKELCEAFRLEFFRHCFDDLNMAGATGTIFTLIKNIKALQDEGRIEPADAAMLLDVLADADRIAGFLQCGTAGRIIEDPLREKIEKLIQEREEARSARDWQRADAIRDELKIMGIEVIDTSAGPRWRTM